MDFSLTGEELDKFNEWNRQHKLVCEIVNGDVHAAIGGRLTFSFTPTGLGVGVSVKCACGATRDCTDVSNW